MATTTKIYSDISGTTAASSGSEIRNVQDHSKFNKDLTSTGTSPTFSVDSNGNGSAQFETDASITQAGSFTGNALVVGQNKSIYFENISDSDLTIGMEGNLTNEKGLNEVGNILSVATTDKDLTSDERRSIVNYFSRKGGSQTEIYDYQAYDVNSKTPTVSLDFTGNGFYRNLPYYFRLGDTYASFADTFMGNSPKLTYGANSNSTMTQGYGPELVTNGDFSGGDNGDWVVQADWSITGGAASKTTGTQNSLYQDLTGVSPDSLYEITFDVSNKSGGGVLVFFTGSNVTTVSGNGLYTFIVKASATNSRLSFQGQVDTTVTIDNISVREAPKIVWAPHNLLDYSEDFTQWGAGRAGTGTPPVVTPNAGTAPDGSLGAHRVQLDLGSGTTSGDFSQLGTLPAYGGAGVPYTLSVWMKSYDGNSYDVMLDFNGAAEQIETITNQWRLVSTTVLSLDTVARPVNVARLRGGTGTSNTADILIWGAHVYRSDLGGMHPVPQSATGFETYVPTSGNAEYLPRVGHHVYNGSAWVNEGLLIESEPRTNFEPDSNPSSPTRWGDVGLDYSGQILRTTGPDGVADSMFKVQESAATAGHYFLETTPVSVGTNTFSCIVKDAGDGRWVYWRTNNDGPNQWIIVNPATGEVTEVGSAVNDYGVIDLGNGFYRLWFSCDNADGNAGWVLGSSNTATPGAALPSFTGTLEAGFYCGFIQIEAGPTPSSYMPTNGGTYTRTAQSLTVPAHWYDADNPTPTGPELVTDFSTYASDADFFADGYVRSDAAKATFDPVNDTLDLTDGVNVRIDGHVSFVEGATYQVSITNDGPDGLSFQDNFTDFSRGIGVGTDTFVFTKGSGANVRVVTGSGNTASISNISVRQVSAPQFGWPEPEFIGPELVTDFSTYADQAAFDVDWTRSTNATFSGSSLVLTNAAFAETTSSDIGYIAGTPVGVTLEVTVTSGTVEVWLGGVAIADYQLASTTSSGTFTFNGVSPGTDGHIYVRSLAAGTTATIDSVSVREINPLSVSLQMDGRMTYADDDVGASTAFVPSTSLVVGTTYVIETVGTTDFTPAGAEANTVGTVFTATAARVGDGTALPMTAQLAKWGGVGMALNTHDTATGGFVFTTDDGNTEYVETSDTALTPGVLVPFNIASRPGSNFVNGAVDGVASTANTTTTSLPDLSNTNLEIAKNFMGTIGQFRQFAEDVGDAGLVTATKPSTEPTLSLTFDGTGGSFYNLNWSE